MTHAYAIVDEVDSILIDEARTPLIISGQGTESTDLYQLADQFVCTLTMGKVKEVESKQEYEDVVEGDYIVDEKNKTATLAQSGVKKAEAFFNVENLTDAENTQLFHNINQAIRAHGIMHKDIDYIVRDGEVLIVDEFTGRIMHGRRYNEGLHQAIEAKEHVNVQRESKTLASITFQNYFRLYKKLSGMTGTAMTEADEFSEIYNLYPVEVPTNEPMIRVDYDDVVYKTENGKYYAIIDQITEAHAKGQPVLVGTVSIEKSEKLSKLLKEKGIKHEVLNAKNNEREAEIIAQAGKYGAITISTNMAGRGTDIMLGGNPEFLARGELRKSFPNDIVVEAMGYAETDNKDVIKAREEYAKLLEKYKAQIAPEAEKVRQAGGLMIIGTERHESRRIDNQLRGRSGRQGDPGESRFFLSMEDDLLRLFGGQRMTRIMDTLKVDENVPIEMRALSKTIENAQKKVEGQHYATRKHVLQYDDVMNQQREIIYKERDKVLDEVDLKDNILEMLDECVEAAVEHFCVGETWEEWDIKALREHFMGWITSPDDLQEEMTRDEIEEFLKNKGRARYDEREFEFSPEVTRNLERMILLRNVDSLWMDHIDAMEQLERGIGLRAYAQQNPVVAFKYEASEVFNEMTEAIRENTVRDMLTVRVRKQTPIKRKAVAKVTGTSGGGDQAEKAEVKKPVIKQKKPGPNDPCWCGSGKKYKKCHMMEDIQNGEV